jgi:hypothetical protein
MSMTEPAMTFGSFLLGDTKEHTLNAGAESLFDEVRVREGLNTAAAFSGAARAAQHHQDAQPLCLSGAAGS